MSQGAKVCFICFHEFAAQQFEKPSQIVYGFDDVCYCCWENYGSTKDEVKSSPMERKLLQNIQKMINLHYKNTAAMQFANQQYEVTSTMHQMECQQLNAKILAQTELHGCEIEMNNAKIRQLHYENFHLQGQIKQLEQKNIELKSKIYVDPLSIDLDDVFNNLHTDWITAHSQ